MKTKKLTEQIENLIQKHTKKGVTATRLSELLDCNLQYVRKVIRKLGNRVIRKGIPSPKCAPTYHWRA